MKVRICYTEESPDYFRKAIRQYYGGRGLASRGECQDWARRFGNSMDDELNALIEEENVESSD